ncbi:hypothetical protein [Streptomyces cinereoruber]|uniref:hypothetical protein n=1 Tax=Streptomyces cinereoruber TaxID=67260 RepID=UPI00362A1239
MTNREFGEMTNGPTTPDGPTVDELRKMRRGYTVSPSRADRAGAAHAVVDGVLVRDGSGGAVAEDEAQAIRRTRAAASERTDPRSFTEYRDQATRQVVRTYEDGRTAPAPAASRPVSQRGDYPRVWYIDMDADAEPQD